MKRTTHYATDSLTACGLSLSFKAKVGGKTVWVGRYKPHRARYGDPVSTPLYVAVTCKNCRRAMKST